MAASPSLRPERPSRCTSEATLQGGSTWINECHSPNCASRFRLSYTPAALRATRCLPHRRLRLAQAASKIDLLRKASFVRIGFNRVWNERHVSILTPARVVMSVAVNDREIELRCVCMEGFGCMRKFWLYTLAISGAIDFGMLLPRGGGGGVICSSAAVKALMSLITSPIRQSMSAARCSGKRSANFGKLKFGS